MQACEKGWARVLLHKKKMDVLLYKGLQLAKHKLGIDMRAKDRKTD